MVWVIIYESYNQNIYILKGYAAASNGLINLLNENGNISEGWLVAFILFFWQFPHFYSLASKNENAQGYIKGGYHQLTIKNQYAAKLWSFISCIFILLIPAYVYKYYSSGKITLN